MRKFSILFVLLVILVLLLFLSKPPSDSLDSPISATPTVDSLNPPLLTTIDSLLSTNNSPSTLDTLITLDDLLLINHPILSKAPLLLKTTQDLIENLNFSIKTFNFSGAHSFIYTLFNSPDISYVCIDSALDLANPPTYFIVTSDKY